VAVGNLFAYLCIGVSLICALVAWRRGPGRAGLADGQSKKSNW
jgi:hypothetical protein